MFTKEFCAPNSFDNCAIIKGCSDHESSSGAHADLLCYAIKSLSAPVKATTGVLHTVNLVATLFYDIAQH